MTFWDKVKQKIWHFLYKFFPSVQKGLLKSGLVWHEKKRQEYHIGFLAPGKTLEELKRHLHNKWGFGNHFVAWTDTGQVLSWRKLADFKDQYHLRVFEEGEIRGHFEFTPEAHPIDHFMEKGEQDRKADFWKFLGEFVTDKQTPMHLTMDPDAWNPDSEITLADDIKK
jgi:hypothetical protein